MTRPSHQNRPVVTVPIDGHFAVAAPDTGTMTYWEVDRGKMRPHPKNQGIRWAPSQPWFEAPTREERAELRDRWYIDVYWPWKAEVARRIAADPAAATRAFHARYPEVEHPPSAVRRALAAEQARIREYEAVRAAASRRRGTSVAGIARRLGIAWGTARMRVAEGELLLVAEPDRARAIVVEHVRGLLGPTHAERMAAAILDGEMFDVAKLVAARLMDAPAVRSQPGPTENPVDAVESGTGPDDAA